MRKVLLILLSLLLYPLAAYAQRNSPWPMHDWMMGYGFGGWLMWILFLVLIGVIIYLVTQGGRNRGGYGAGSDLSPRETPIDILKKRYAKGEITKEEYERMKKDLEF